MRGSEVLIFMRVGFLKRSMAGQVRRLAGLGAKGVRMEVGTMRRGQSRLIGGQTKIQLTAFVAVVVVLPRLALQDSLFNTPVKRGQSIL